MSGLNFLSILFLLFSFVSCSEADYSSDKKREFRPVSDSHSYANIEQIRTKHLHLDIDVDFEGMNEMYDELFEEELEDE